MKKSYIKILRIFFTVIIVGGIIYFYIAQLNSNWNRIKSMKFSINPIWITVSVIFMMAFYLLTTYNWQLLINSQENKTRLNFRSSFAIMNISGLTKYLPGKVWAYAIQMFVLKDRGFKPSTVLFDNVVLLIFAISIPIFIGAQVYILALLEIGIILKTLIALLLLILYLLFLYFFENLLKFMINLTNKVFKKTVEYKSLSKKQIYIIQILTTLEFLFLILANAFLCPGLHLNLNIGESIYIGVFAMLSATIGFIALIAPGGLGVQEIVLYSFISSRFGIETALIFPIIIRILLMFVDISLAITAAIVGRNDIIQYYKFKRG